jgi:outer membrane receptor protein involved in Fe transport
MFGKNYTQAQNWVENYFLRYSWEIAGDANDANLWGKGTYGDAIIDYQTYNLKLTHSLSTSTFYEVSVEHLQRNYDIHAPDRWDRTLDNEVLPGYFVDDMPYGFWPELGTNGIEGNAGFGGHTARYKDESKASTTTIKADLVSQVNFENQFKGGIEVVFNNFDLKYGRRNQNDENLYEIIVDRTDSPIRVSAYVQDKLEAYGFIANLGLRFDYSNSNTQWYGGDLYNPYYFGGRYDPESEYETKDTESQFQVSPRLGISHPITENSKLFFNYGHFKQLPTYEALLREQRSSTNDMERFGDPGLILAKTVAYELGFDYSLGNQFLVQLAGYYKDITDQQYDVQLKGRSVGYEMTTNNGYEDIRGLEITLRKSTGHWISGFANYTYEARSTGNFGPDELYQNPSLQREYNSKAESFQQEKLVPRPYARLNLRLTTPYDFGSKYGLAYLMSDWMLNFMVNWQSGNWQTWNENQIEGVTLNVQEKDYFNLDLRLGKSVNIDKWDISLYMDVFNALNIKRLSWASFIGGSDDFRKYMLSLHLPESDAYPNIPGDDKIYDYRANGAEYQPIVQVGDLNNITFEDGLIYYYDGKYYENDANTEVDSDKMKKILDDKAYIDMPNKSSFWYLDPRHIVFGFRINYNF